MASRTSKSWGERDQTAGRSHGTPPQAPPVTGDTAAAPDTRGNCPLAVRSLISAAQELTVRTAHGMEMNLSDMTAIMQLSEHGPMGVAELARHLGVSPPTTTVLVDRLERAGHVERVRDTVDRRRVRITDTPAGHAVTQHAWLPAILEIDEVCRSLSGPEQVFARDLLGRLTAAMTRSGQPRVACTEGPAAPEVGGPGE